MFPPPFSSAPGPANPPESIPSASSSSKSSRSKKNAQGTTGTPFFFLVSPSPFSLTFFPFPPASSRTPPLFSRSNDTDTTYRQIHPHQARPAPLVGPRDHPTPPKIKIPR